jgi:predicted Zn-dependent protease
MNLPENLLRNPHFSRYYRTFRKNELSLVFIPMAQICREQGLFQEAKEICEAGLAHHPGSVGGRLMLAKILFDLNEKEEVKKLLEPLLQEYPGQEEASQLLQRMAPPRREETYAAEESENEAEEVTEITKREEAAAPPLWENLTMAKIYADQGETKLAKQIVNRVLSRDPKNVAALKLREEMK